MGSGAIGRGGTRIERISADRIRVEPPRPCPSAADSYVLQTTWMLRRQPAGPVLLLHQVPVEVERPPRDDRPAEELLHALARTLPHLAEPLRIGEQLVDRRGQVAGEGGR